MIESLLMWLIGAALCLAIIENYRSLYYCKGLVTLVIHILLMAFVILGVYAITTEAV